MSYALIVHTVPPLVFSWPDLIDVGDEQSAINGEVPNVTVTLDNARGQITPLLADPPLRAAATLTERGIPIFYGRVQAVSLGTAATITIEN